MSFWLCGWAFGEVAVINQLLFANTSRAPKLFLLFSLCGWTVAGTMAIFQLLSLLRPSRPESVRLELDSLRYDAGWSHDQVYRVACHHLQVVVCNDEYLEPASAGLKEMQQVLAVCKPAEAGWGSCVLTAPPPEGGGKQRLLAAARRGRGRES